jgi:hypothetical protein
VNLLRKREEQKSIGTNKKDQCISAKEDLSLTSRRNNLNSGWKKI